MEPLASRRLKDSDVTWLYGPLHIGNDWTDYSQRKTSKLHAGHRKTSTDALPGPYKTNFSASISRSGRKGPFAGCKRLFPLQ